MGGMKFETTTPQKFLFGAISDLNYLGPYTLGADLNLPKVDAKNSNGKPSLVKPIEILINLRKSSLRKVFNVTLNKYDYESLNLTKNDHLKTLIEWFEHHHYCQIKMIAKKNSGITLNLPLTLQFHAQPEFIILSKRPQKETWSHLQIIQRNRTN